MRLRERDILFPIAFLSLALCAAGPIQAEEDHAELENVARGVKAERPEISNAVLSRALTSARAFIKDTPEIPKTSWKAFTASVVDFFQPGDKKLADKATTLVKSLDADQVIAKLRKDERFSADKALAKEIARRMNIDTIKAGASPDSDEAKQLAAILEAVKALPKKPDAQQANAPAPLPPKNGDKNIDDKKDGAKQADAQKDGAKQADAKKDDAKKADAKQDGGLTPAPLAGAKKPPQLTPGPLKGAPQLTPGALGTNQPGAGGNPPIGPVDTGDQLGGDPNNQLLFPPANNDFLNPNLNPNDIVNNDPNEAGNGRNGDKGGKGKNGEQGKGAAGNGNNDNNQQEQPPQFPPISPGSPGEHAQVPPLQPPQIPDGKLQIADMNGLFSAAIQAAGNGAVDGNLAAQIGPADPDKSSWYSKATDAIVKSIENLADTRMTRMMTVLQGFMNAPQAARGGSANPTMAQQLGGFGGGGPQQGYMAAGGRGPTPVGMAAGAQPPGGFPSLSIPSPGNPRGVRRVLHR